MSETAPLVTIVTPSYNQGQFLEATIKSVIDQSYPNLEYFVFDGGSTDNSVDIIRRYETQIDYWVSEPDKGQSDALNKGFARAKGKYIAWLNSDDIFLPDAIRRGVAAMEQHPEAGMIYANCAKIDENGAYLSWPRYGQYGLLDLLSMRVIAQPTVFMRRDIYEQTGGLDLSINLQMDHALWIRMARLAPIIYVDDYFAGAREHANAKNMVFRLGFGQTARRIVNDAVEAYDDVAALVKANERRVKAGLNAFEAGYLLDDYPGKALLYYLKAVIAYPPIAPHYYRLMTLSLVKTMRLRWAEKLLYRFRDYLHGRRYRVEPSS